jgi:hypothetical protein
MILGSCLFDTKITHLFISNLFTQTGAYPLSQILSSINIYKLHHPPYSIQTQYITQVTWLLVVTPHMTGHCISFSQITLALLV